MSEIKKISIIISVLNGANTLKRCVESIVNQDYIDWELIIIDGCSTDSTLDIINSYLYFDMICPKFYYSSY